ncbi:probable F-box protein At1g44080 [Rosa rugosa]|uniref:probable F-box protein At1g44080 n=1 Tax=Rosa rugosa TaxID=74645 RepID=UPI002B40F945|nr:probable F-box protein At1g44080 [Rosa rugosa]
MHLLDSVSDRLVSLSDYLRFSIVCKSWYCVAKDNQKVHHQFPMLLISTEKEGTWNVYSVMDNKVLDLQIRLPNKRFCGSSKGWLVTVEENFAVTLLNPFSRVIGMEEKENSIIHLPPLEGPKQGREQWVKKCDYYVYKAMISADPVVNAEDCVVVVIYEEQCRLSFIRLNKDKAWTYVHRPRPVQDVLHFGNRYYAVNYWSNLYSFDITTQSNSDVDCFVSSIPLQNVYTKRYLVDSNEKELMMVQRHMAYEGSKLVTKKFKTFKFKLDDIFDWIEQETLGDVALFVGDNSTVSVVASSFSGCQPNCIYFNDDNNCMKGCFEGDFGVYNVGTKSISRLYTVDAMSLLEKTKLHPIWIVPTLQL